MKKFVLLTSILLLAAAPAFAHCGKCGVGEDMKTMEEGEAHDKIHDKVSKMSEALGLTEEQTAQVTEALNAKMTKKAALKEEKKESMDAIHTEYMDTLKSILTEEQIAKHEAMKAEMKGSDHEHKGSGHEKKEGKKGSDKEHKGSHN